MAERKPFLLRIDPAVLKAMRRWADDDLRSLGLRQSRVRRGSRDISDKEDRLRQSHQTQAPPEYQPQVKAYKKALSRSRRQD